jgi:Protein of unknown function (DUF3303)
LAKDLAIFSRHPGIRLRRPVLFMIIERFKDRDAVPVYRRVRDEGIVFPEGLKYIGSWIELLLNTPVRCLGCSLAQQE